MGKQFDYDDFERKLSNAINSGKSSVSFQINSLSNKIVERWLKRYKRENGTPRELWGINNTRGSEVSFKQ